ncbi:hypothetical protein DPMN_181133 [Dreissena polymorpha]|uniref:Uncharacterized protein n=1 Tax=Dreissena polymorpha TaxID=45954 RepID=A0A9D4DD89_DREPO|nr:hypothetical protein DPMN_181133 [Dreissena polymorpha]
MWLRVGAGVEYSKETTPVWYGYTNRTTNKHEHWRSSHWGSLGEKRLHQPPEMRLASS